ncbi:MAG: nodulation protein NfeD [Candidatus Marinimicrobia bacterium]|nr:nodulation protein NfeD [Candidatus Neomarinimicrobiota bacterium]MBL7047012.1 nodulation protein NfeD [Candidatus Neomarinimicrobiota bacterium]
MVLFVPQGLSNLPSPVALLSSTAISQDTTDLDSSGIVHALTVTGAITPITAEYICEAIEGAFEAGAQCLIIQLDTPGGLMESMREIIKCELNAGIPVVVYVAPDGARAASAGVFITLAAHVAAMSPGTNIGAAHPVMISGLPGSPGDTSSTIIDKATNDAVAYIQSIAEKRGRNAEWAREAVIASASITALEALEAGVIDTVAGSLAELMDYMDGQQVEVDTGTVTISTAAAQVENIAMSLRYRILKRLSDPNLAYLFLLLGIYGIFFELANPGSIFPGAVGAIFLILAFFSFQMLPINYAGLALIFLSAILFILEVNVTSYGLLSIGGVVSLLLGSLMLFESVDPVMKVSWHVILPVTVFTVLFFLFAIGFGIKAQRSKPVTGISGMIGLKGLSRTEIAEGGVVMVNGELWKAVSDKAIPPDMPVEVVNVEGMILKVKREGKPG